MIDRRRNELAEIQEDVRQLSEPLNLEGLCSDGIIKKCPGKRGRRGWFEVVEPDLIPQVLWSRAKELEVVEIKEGESPIKSRGYVRL
jgi:hypothetical protein